VEWMDSLTPTIGATGLLAVVVLMILRGALIPRRVHEDRMADKDAQIKTWKDAALKEAETNEVQRGHISILLQGAQTTRHVLEALPKAAAMNGTGGDDRAELAPSEEAH
jgi:hypothetical protein